MYYIIIQEIREDGRLCLHRESEDVVLEEDLDYYERYYSRSRDPYSGGYDSTATVINVFELEKASDE